MPPAPPPAVEVVVVRGVELPPSPADAAFSIVRLGPEALHGAQRLDTALGDVPGVTLFRRTSSLGANPTTQGISLRAIAGSAASRALVTLDGVPRNDPFGGWVIWSGLPPESIGAATIVRGAGAGPYGAGALTGVVALSSAPLTPGAWTADGSAASFGTRVGDGRIGGAAALTAGPGVLTLAGAAEHSDGWDPVRAGRGPADDRLRLDAGGVSGRFQADIGAVATAVAASAYDENRAAGLVGAGSTARGATVSVTAARAPDAGVTGWRAQAWTSVSDLANRSVSVAAGQASTSLADDQYSTPAIGYGLNLAARRRSDTASLEVGADLRGADGESREHFAPVAGQLTKDRRSGGDTLTAGLYADATRRFGALLLVAGARLDDWASFDGHRLEHQLSTGAATLDQQDSGKNVVLPSGRLALRWDFAPDLYARAAGYTGFRAPTLNELYRTYRVGNVVTEANAGLAPERLYGGEGGFGGSAGPVGFEATVFYNRLTNAVTNVTLHAGPYVSPIEGVIPVGGALQQRENLPGVDALGVEARVTAALGRRLDTTVSADWTDARVDGGAADPQLTGLRPAETPRYGLVWSLDWRASQRLSMTADLRYESARFDDDLNTLRLPQATTVDARVDWRVSRGASLFVAAENVFDAAVVTQRTPALVDSYGPPRMLRVGVTLSGG